MPGVFCIPASLCLFSLVPLRLVFLFGWLGRSHHESESPTATFFVVLRCFRLPHDCSRGPRRTDLYVHYLLLIRLCDQLYAYGSVSGFPTARSRLQMLAGADEVR